MKISKTHIAALCALIATLTAWAVMQTRVPEGPDVAIEPSTAVASLNDWREVLQAHRKVIVLFSDEKKLSALERDVANQVGHAIFHENRTRVAMMEQKLEAGLPVESLKQISEVLDYVESGTDLFDADRLAFRDLLTTLRVALARESSLPAIKMHKRVTEDLDALAEIERNYEKEMRQIYNRFDSRAIELKRERWDDYVAKLHQQFTRDQILKDHGFVAPYPNPPTQPVQKAKGDEGAEIFGYGLPPKTVVLTFDDGPHTVYSEDIAAILKQYGVPAVFFQVGRNLGSITADGKPKLTQGAQISKRLTQAGHLLANHSFSHAQLAKEKGDTLRNEVLNTDAMLKAIDPARSALFRFPYGAHSQEGLAVVAEAQLRSVMWNIDSLDWSDPVPSSIADRVIRTVEQEGRGIILFHDIHERTVKALPLVLDRLQGLGYQFATWDGAKFSMSKSSETVPTPVARSSLDTGYANSWAVVIGIDEYTQWPRLQHAVKDAAAVAKELTERLGFSKERVITLSNAQATRSGILAAFNDGLARSGVKKNDRIFVFFAGHGATRKLSSGRDLGYIVPVDSDPSQVASDAIPMTEIQNIAESLTAKHVLFVMDACYSGLGLTRGAAVGNFLRDNARRTGRQMLTAGGADQLVADGGPNGHSVFTWTLLQGLGGKADLNGDGIITATELAAYVAPAVASVAPQTPAFGSLPGSEGGDFVFELPVGTEFLSAQSSQLPSEVIVLNSKLDLTRPRLPEPTVNGVMPAAPLSVTVKDLQGQAQKLTTPSAITVGAKQMAQNANDRGLQLYREKNYQDAEAEFTHALKYRPDFALAANNLGFVYFKQDKFVEASRWFENTIKMDPSRSVAYLNLGDAYARLGQQDKARNAYQTYLALNPTGAMTVVVREQLDKLNR
jgi:uncharacterized caspase-like protein/peptidoglycan/xylan/chitin deacetylase (PgdA/CDA1 family)